MEPLSHWKVISPARRLKVLFVVVPNPIPPTRQRSLLLHIEGSERALECPNDRCRDGVQPMGLDLAWTYPQDRTRKLV